MNSRWLAIAALAALAVAGCRSRPEQRAIMDSYQEELRRYEGIIYDLEYQNNVLCLENERLKKRLEGSGASKPRRVDDGPRLFPRADSAKPEDEPPSVEIDMGDPSPSPSPTRPGPTNKPVTPDVEPEKPDIPAEDVELSPPTTKPKPEQPPEAHPTDIDVPPLSKPTDKPTATEDDDPPRAPSILKPVEKPKPSETLPLPRPSSAPNTKPKPELLPAPTARRTSFVDAAGSRSQEPGHLPNFASPQAPLPQQQQWTPRTLRRSTSDETR